MCNYDQSVKLMIRFGGEDCVFVTESDNYSDAVSLMELGIWLDISLISICVFLLWNTVEQFHEDNPMCMWSHGSSTPVLTDQYKHCS